MTTTIRLRRSHLGTLTATLVDRGLSSVATEDGPYTRIDVRASEDATLAAARAAGVVVTVCHGC